MRRWSVNGEFVWLSSVWEAWKAKGSFHNKWQESIQLHKRRRNQRGTETRDLVRHFQSNQESNKLQAPGYSQENTPFWVQKSFYRRRALRNCGCARIQWNIKLAHDYSRESKFKVNNWRQAVQICQTVPPLSSLISAGKHDNEPCRFETHGSSVISHQNSKRICAINQ